MKEEDKCKKCNGEKVLEEKKEFEIKLEPGVSDNKDYKFIGEGNEIVYIILFKNLSLMLIQAMYISL